MKKIMTQSVLIATFLTGCATSEPVEVQKQYPRPPDDAMQECRTDLPDATGPTRKEVLEARSKTARMVIRCAERQKTLKQYINEIIDGGNDQQ